MRVGGRLHLQCRVAALVSVFAARPPRPGQLADADPDQRGRSRRCSSLLSRWRWRRSADFPELVRVEVARAGSGPGVEGRLQRPDAEPAKAVAAAVARRRHGMECQVGCRCWSGWSEPCSRCRAPRPPARRQLRWLLREGKSTVAKAAALAAMVRLPLLVRLVSARPLLPSSAPSWMTPTKISAVAFASSKAVALADARCSRRPRWLSWPSRRRTPLTLARCQARRWPQRPRPMRRDGVGERRDLQRRVPGVGETVLARADGQ